VRPTFNIFDFSLMSLEDFQDNELATSVLSTINSFGNDFIPQKIDVYEPLKVKYDPDNLGNAIKLWLNEKNAKRCVDDFGEAAGQVLMAKKRGHKVEYMMTWHKGKEPQFNAFSVGVDIQYFTSDERLEYFLDMCKQLIRILNPVHGKLCNCKYSDWGEPINLQVRLPDVLWVTLLGKPYIQMFGREKILSTPCYRVEELGEDLIWLQATKSVFEPVPQEVKNAIKEHLCKDAFVWDGKDYRHYKDGVVPDFDFSAVTLDSTKQSLQPQWVKTTMVNFDDKRRMELLGIDSPKYRGGVVRFQNLDASRLKMLIDEGFASVEDAQHHSPSLGEVFKYIQQYPEFMASGYAVSPRRSDYRISIDGVMGKVDVDSDAYNDFIRLFNAADEFESTDGFCRAWFE
jgi:hypothetical protein